MKAKKQQPRSQWLTAGIHVASRFGFYLFEEKREGAVRWTVYSRKDGVSVALYWPTTGKWMTVGRLGEHRGQEGRFNALFVRLRSLCDESGVD